MHFNTLLSLSPSLLDTLVRLGFEEMTPIQAKAIPAIIEGCDIVAHAKTGSGKTLAFALPLVMRATFGDNRPYALVVTPTRELAEQIARTIRDIAASLPNLKVATLYGGVPLRPQAENIANGVQILVGTPGRILDHLDKKTLGLESIGTVVFDEADKMLSMGFQKEIDAILLCLPTQRQTLFFSATFPDKIAQLTQSILHEPLFITADVTSDADTIKEIVHQTQNKFETLLATLHHYTPASVLIFLNTKEAVITLSQQLYELGHSVIDLQGNLEQYQREEALIQFKNGSIRILVATDVASRGLDIHQVAMVINYELPFNRETYIHRIGRTGRAGAFGIALSFYTSYENTKRNEIATTAQEIIIKPLPKQTTPLISEYRTLMLYGGRKEKLRKGDIVGALCQEIGVSVDSVGSITIGERYSYIALHISIVEKVKKSLDMMKVKGKKVRGKII